MAGPGAGLAPGIPGQLTVAATSVVARERDDGRVSPANDRSGDLLVPTGRLLAVGPVALLADRLVKYWVGDRSHRAICVAVFGRQGSHRQGVRRRATNWVGFSPVPAWIGNPGER